MKHAVLVHCQGMTMVVGPFASVKEADAFIAKSVDAVDVTAFEKVVLTPPKTFLKNAKW